MDKKSDLNNKYNQLKILRTCYNSLIKGDEYELSMAEKIKEEIELIENELNPFRNVDNTK